MESTVGARERGRSYGRKRCRYGRIRRSVWSFPVDDTTVYGWTRLLNG
ncbi:unnamed protein product, partial [Rotaria magnacalcarata]